MEFIARLSLDEVQSAQSIPWLPKTGALLFFLDMEKMPWGDEPNDRGGWAVLHVPDLEKASGETQTPGVSECELEHYAVELVAVNTLPEWLHDIVKPLELTAEEEEEYQELVDQPFSGKPKHQVGGFPHPAQNSDMERACEIAINGWDGKDRKTYEGARGAALKEGAANWRLLFQIASDEYVDMMWGDAGYLYFWVREQEARTGDFSNAWLLRQCY